MYKVMHGAINSLHSLRVNLQHLIPKGVPFRCLNTCIETIPRSEVASGARTTTGLCVSLYDTRCQSDLHW